MDDLGNRLEALSLSIRDLEDDVASSDGVSSAVDGFVGSP